MNKRKTSQTSLLVQWLKKSAFLMQETRVRCLVSEEATEQLSLCTRAHELRPLPPEPPGARAPQEEPPKEA